MGLTREDLIDPKHSEKDKAEIKVALDNYMANDAWVSKIFKKIGILITSHPGNRAYLKASIETHKKLGLWICLAYDNYLHPDQQDIDYNKIMPAKDVMDNVDTFIMPHYQTWGGVLYPWFWLMKFGVETLQGFEYIYCTNGDFILEKPENFDKLFNLLGDADIMTSGPDRDDPPTANTAGFIAKAPALKAIIKHMQDHFVPFEIYEKYTQEFVNAEGRFGQAIKKLNLKQIRVDPPKEDMLKFYPGQGTWYDLLGFRHIHAEHNYAYRNKGIPPEPKWLDPRFMGDEYRVIKEYWEAQDKKILKQWWAK